MKNDMPNRKTFVIIASAVFWVGLAPAQADNQQQNQSVAVSTTQTSDDSSSAVSSAPPVTIETVELTSKKDKAKVVTWLGLAVEESSEALSSQLGLKSGEGLIVSLVAADSPAAKAEFHKNDVLVELDGQMLVHPLQLRKLVQMHAEGDTVSLTFYRSGKKQNISVKLGKTSWAESSEPEDPFSPERQNFQFQFNNLDGLHWLTGPSSMVGQSLARVGLDKAKMNTEIKRTMEQTRKAIQDSVRHASSDQRSLAGLDRELAALAREGVDMDKDTTVVISNKHNSNKTMVQTDDSGSYVIEANEKTHLTARDKDGKLLFEGEIDTEAEREKVPKVVWEKVAPMFEQITAPNGIKPKTEGKSKGNSQFLKQSARSCVIQGC
jgi:hypothetical protein